MLFFCAKHWRLPGWNEGSTHGGAPKEPMGSGGRPSPAMVLKFWPSPSLCWRMGSRNMMKHQPSKTIKIWMVYNCFYWFMTFIYQTFVGCQAVFFWAWSQRWLPTGSLRSGECWKIYALMVLCGTGLPSWTSLKISERLDISHKHFRITTSYNQSKLLKEIQ